MKDCVFCNVLERKDSKKLIYGTKNALTILSNPFLGRGYCLIISKRHVEMLSELNKEELDELMQFIGKNIINIIKKYKGGGIRQNYRSFLNDNKKLKKKFWI